MPVAGAYGAEALLADDLVNRAPGRCNRRVVSISPTDGSAVLAQAATVRQPEAEGRELFALRSH